MREICDVCKNNRAKNHLCDDCLRARGAATGVQFPILDGTQRCYFCSAGAQCTGKNQEWEQPVRGQSFHFTCFRCAELYHEFLSASLADMPEGLSLQEQVDALSRAVSDSDRRVYERVHDQNA